MAKAAKRKELKMLRVSHDLTQDELGERIGYNRHYISTVELGKRRGSPEFWQALQKEFNLSDADMWRMSNNA